MNYLSRTIFFLIAWELALPAYSQIKLQQAPKSQTHSPTSDSKTQQSYIEWAKDILFNTPIAAAAPIIGTISTIALTKLVHFLKKTRPTTLPGRDVKSTDSSPSSFHNSDLPEGNNADEKTRITPQVCHCVSDQHPTEIPQNQNVVWATQASSLTESRTFTADLRFGRMIHDLMQAYPLASSDDGLIDNSSPRTWVLFGPGSLQTSLTFNPGTPDEYEQDFEYSPQVVETSAFIRPQDSFVIVDGSQSVLDGIRTWQYNRFGAQHTLSIESNFANWPEGREILTSFLDFIPDQAPMNIQTVHADFEHMGLRENSIDVMLGTVSLSFAWEALRNAPQEDRTSFVMQLLKALKNNGRLYVEAGLATEFMHLGSEVLIQPPFGYFTFAEHRYRITWIAPSSSITFPNRPDISLLKGISGPAPAPGLMCILRIDE